MSAHDNRPVTCEVIASARFRGDQEDRVGALPAVAGRTREAHIVLRIGRVLLYIEDRPALDTLSRAVRSAEELADDVFGPLEDAASRAEARTRRRFEESRPEGL